MDWSSLQPWITLFIASTIAVSAVLALAGATLMVPRLAIYPFLLVLFVHTGSGYGMATEIVPLYSRGSGRLFVTFWQIGLVAALAWIAIATSLHRSSAQAVSAAPRPSFWPWTIAWAVLLVAHVLAGLLLGVPPDRIVAQQGFSEFLWLSVLMAAVILAFRSERELQELLDVVVAVALVRAVYGLFRWLFLGGDPANIYAEGGTNVRLTYFDIPDSLVATLAIVISLYRSFGPGTRERGWRRLVHLAVIPLCSAIVLFSYRRTAWVGLIAALAIALLALPRRERVRLLLLAVPFVFVGLGLAMRQRLEQFSGEGFLRMFLFDFMTPDVGEESDRLLELKLGFEAFLSSPIYGKGAWGQYADASMVGWQTGETGGDFVHSGLLHLAMKTGLIGVSIFVGFLWALGRTAWLALREASPDLRGAAIVGIAGVAFVAVDFMIAPPYGRMQELGGLCCALLFACRRVAASSRSATTVRTMPSAVPSHAPWFPQGGVAPALPVSVRLQLNR